MFGLKNSDITAIQIILSKFPMIQRAYIFGSRAMDTHDNGSDVDMALVGKDISYKTLLEISSLLNEETLMPYHFDVINYHEIKNKDLKNHINRVGKVIFDAVEIPIVEEPDSDFRRKK